MRRVRDIEEEHQDIDIKKAPIKNTVQPKILKLSIYASVETSKKKKTNKKSAKFHDKFFEGCLNFSFCLLATFSQHFMYGKGCNKFKVMIFCQVF